LNHARIEAESFNLIDRSLAEIVGAYRTDQDGIEAQAKGMC